MNTRLRDVSSRRGGEFTQPRKNLFVVLLIVLCQCQVMVIFMMLLLSIQNFIVADEVDKVNNAVMRFRRGHPFLNFMLGELVSNFRSTKWGNQGGYSLVSQVQYLANR